MVWLKPPNSLYPIHKPHLPPDCHLVYRGISGEQFHGNSTSCVGHQLRMPQSFQYVAQPRIGLFVVDFGGLEQAVDLSTGGRALGCALNSQALRPITNGFIARSAELLSMGKKASLHVAIQPAPVAGQITDGSAE